MTAPWMTRADALAEARKRWGKLGNILLRNHKPSDPRRYEVGVEHRMPDGSRGGEWEVLGTGDSWESAFADADRRAKP